MENAKRNDDCTPKQKLFTTPWERKLLSECGMHTHNIWHLLASHSKFTHFTLSSFFSSFAVRVSLWVLRLSGAFCEKNFGISSIKWVFVRGLWGGQNMIAYGCISFNCRDTNTQSEPSLSRWIVDATDDRRCPSVFTWISIQISNLFENRKKWQFNVRQYEDIKRCKYHNAVQLLWIACFTSTFRWKFLRNRIF